MNKIANLRRNLPTRRRAVFPHPMAMILLLWCALPLSEALSQPRAESGDTRLRAAAVEPAASPLDGLAIHRHRLENGMRVVLSPDQSIPTVAIAIYYDVGSRNEERGRSGFAHLFEHMMFQGSENVEKGAHFNLVMHRGGSMNGTTSVDRTNYYETLPSNELALGLWLEADRMRSLQVTDQNFENQRQTVMEERRQSYDNRPYMQSMLRINELAYGSYWPYAHSTIGLMSDLERAPLEAVQEFWTQYYPPNNAVLSVAGDFDTDEARALITRYFGDIEPRTVPAASLPTIQPQTAERVDQLLDPLAQLPAFHIAYHIPPRRHADHYPLELLAVMLGDGKSSRLYQRLVKETAILQEIQISTDDRRGPDLFSVWAIVAEGADDGARLAREAFYEAIGDIAENGVSERELTKAKNRIASAFVFGMQSQLSRAMHLAEFELYDGDANHLRGELRRYLAVAPDAIKRVAMTYFHENNRTILDVLPAGVGETGEGS